LKPRQRGVITVDAFPDRRYEGVLDEISPEANRQKATVQVKVRVLRPDEFLRPEMNASVAFLADRAQAGVATSRPMVVVPASTVRDGAVFVVLNGRAVRRPVKVAGSTPQGLRVEEGLIGGEDIIASPPAGLKDGDKVKRKGS
jgi:HlyD family secretion protein